MAVVSFFVAPTSSPGFSLFEFGFAGHPCARRSRACLPVGGRISAGAFAVAFGYVAAALGLGGQLLPCSDRLSGGQPLTSILNL